MKNEYTLGQVVKSTAGRDKGRFMIVKEVIDEDYLYVCDGSLRKSNQPKKKKIKHLAKTNHIIEEIQEKLTKGERIQNALIVKHLKPFNENGDSKENNEED